MASRRRESSAEPEEVEEERDGAEEEEEGRGGGVGMEEQREISRIYFTPGMFGFGRLGPYSYFSHLEKAIEKHFAAAGREAQTFILDVPPTASIRRRAGRLAELIANTCEEDGVLGPIHLVGHSTGGLDARLVASPSAVLPVEPDAMRWLPRLASVTTMNTPHFGTPLASFFATVSGQRMLYAVSALTVIALGLGAPPLAAASALVIAVGRLDRALGVELGMLDRATDALMRVLDDARRREVRLYLEAIREDQGSIIQVTPEAMDLFQCGVENRPGLRYQSTASMAPPPTPTQWMRTLGGPWSVISAPLFASLYSLTARWDERYPCAAPSAGPETEAMLARAFQRSPGARANDGVVPIRSQLWGKLVWCGYGDHLDVLGHFRDAHGVASHVDWLASGAEFQRSGFEALTRAVARGMLEGEGAPASLL
ncbi:esterase/lipase family protein [Pendulispora albinea]|uniref:Triacylglycerol lipase n=1 Tax=Pendulispora albinea TaxID=2741071 RepID=A0ABZ2MCZ2_9BACT